MSPRRFVIFACVLTGFLAYGADSKVVSVYRSRADLAYAESRFDDALENYLYLRNKVADDEPLFLAASEGMLKTLFAQKKYVRIIKEAEDAGTQFLKPPRSAKLPLSASGKAIFAHWVGRVHVESSRYDAALKAFKQAMGQGSPDRQAVTSYQYGRCFLLKEETEKAITHFNSMKSNPAPNSPIAQAGRLGMMAVYMERKQWDEFDKLLKASEPLATGRWSIEVTFIQLRMLLAREQAVQAGKVYRKKLLANLRESKDPFVKNHLKVDTFFEVVRRIGLEMTKAKGFRTARDFYVELQPALPRDDLQQEIFLDMAASALEAMKHYRENNSSAQANNWYTLADDDLKRFLIKYKASELIAEVAYYQGQLLLSQKRNEEAMVKFLQAFNHAKASPLYRYESAMQLAEGALRTDKRNDAEKWFITASKQGVDKPRKANADFRRSKLLSDMKDYGKSLKAFTDFIAAYPKSQLIFKARYNQGSAAFELGDFKKSTEIFANFLKIAKKDEELRPAAMHFLGMSLYKGKQLLPAMAVFRDLEKTYPTDPLVPRALLDAAEIANHLNRDVEFVALCTKVITVYPKSDWVPHALYKRIHHSLYYHFDLAKAKEDMELYFAAKTGYPLKHPDSAAGILMWFGDFHFNAGNLEKAGEYFLRAANEFPQSIHAHTAMTEGARAFFVISLADEDKICARTLDVLTKLESLPAERVEKRVLAKGFLLHAEVLAWQLRYDEAEAYFKKCRDACTISDPPLRFYYPSIIRVGDMNYVLAGREQNTDEKKRLLNESVKIYTSVIDAELVQAPDRSRARYQRGLVNRMLKNDAEAYKDFRAVFEAYFDNHLRDELYLLKAATQLVDYYESLDQLEKAQSVLKRVMPEVEDREFIKWAQETAKKMQGRAPKSLGKSAPPVPKPVPAPKPKPVQ